MAQLSIAALGTTALLALLYRSQQVDLSFVIGGFRMISLLANGFSTGAVTMYRHRLMSHIKRQSRLESDYGR